MEVVRVVDAFCAPCDDVRPHAVLSDDPSSCFCGRCGTSQVLVAPLTPGSDERPRSYRRSNVRRPNTGQVRLRPAPAVDKSQWDAAGLIDGARLALEALQDQDDAVPLRAELQTVCRTLEEARRLLRGPGGSAWRVAPSAAR